MKNILTVLILFSLNSFSQQSDVYPADIEKVLFQTPSNRKELETALGYFQKKGDSLQLKAIQFLIRNMDIHSSYNYYWADSAERKIDYNELDYDDFQSAVDSFNIIRASHKGVHPVAYSYRDIDSIKAGYLIENIESAFKSWESHPGGRYSFDEFCEYILPYRISVEPLQNWRKTYEQKFAWISDTLKIKPIEKAIFDISIDFKSWFLNDYLFEKRNEPLPRLGALQLLHRKRGACEDIAGLQVFTLRSQGLPASIDYVPFWATSSASHFFNSTMSENQKVVPFDVLKPGVVSSVLLREPGKVLRTTYSKKASTIAARIPVEKIPKGVLRAPNYIDVTHEYWDTADVSADVFQNKSNSTQTAFACVFNYFAWRPVWAGEITNNEVTFTNMGKGAVYLPQYYINGTLVPAGWPIALGYKNKLVLQPDLVKKRIIKVIEQENYLKFQPGKSYTLQYWNNGWKAISTKLAVENGKELVFEEVPLNALLLLRPEYTKNKERPFIITADGTRVWF